MLKQLLLIAALVPTAAGANDFEADDWLQVFLGNRVNILNCINIATTDLHAFHEDCDLDVMVILERDSMIEFYEAKSDFPDDPLMLFILEQFSEETDEYIKAIYKNVLLAPYFSSLMLRLYTIQGMTMEYASNDK